MKSIQLLLGLDADIKSSVLRDTSLKRKWLQLSLTPYRLIGPDLMIQHSSDVCWCHASAPRRVEWYTLLRW
jgi:hypothetical protein